MVDERPPDNDTTYVQGLNIGETELYSIDDCPLYINTINLVEVIYLGALIESGYNYVRDLVRIGTVNYTGGTTTIVPIEPAYTVYKRQTHYISPATTSAWGTAEINGMEAGFDIV